MQEYHNQNPYNLLILVFEVPLQAIDKHPQPEQEKQNPDCYCSQSKSEKHSEARHADKIIHVSASEISECIYSANCRN